MYPRVKARRAGGDSFGNTANRVARSPDGHAQVLQFAVPWRQIEAPPADDGHVNRPGRFE
jgi:hypothetical protein